MVRHAPQWDGASQKLKFRLDGTFDDALVWGTADDNVYAFFHRAKTPSEPFGATTVVRLHDGAFQVHASSGAYALGALRTVEVPRLGVVAVLSKANDPASVALVDADLKAQLALPALPLASGSGATIDETLDATASVSEGGVLSVWVLTRAGRVFRWTEGGAEWSELRPFPTSDDPTEIPRGTGLAPTRAQNINGVQVIRDVFRGQHLRREIATLEGSDSVFTSLPNRPVYSAGDILPHGRSVSYNPSPGIFDWDRPLVDSGRWCFSLGCRSWGTVDVHGARGGRRYRRIDRRRSHVGRVDCGLLLAGRPTSPLSLERPDPRAREARGRPQVRLGVGVAARHPLGGRHPRGDPPVGGSEAELRRSLLDRGARERRLAVVLERQP